MAYTHDFEIKSNNHTISGEVEFDTDGNMSYKTKEGLELEFKESKAFNNLLASWKEFFDSFDGIDKIELNIKT